MTDQTFSGVQIPGQGDSTVRAFSRAKLSGPNGTVDFEYNPTEISISHNAEGYSEPVKKDGNEGRSMMEALATRGSTRLILAPLTFTGSRCLPSVEMLISWVTPYTSTENGKKPKRYTLSFEWGSVGSGFHYAVELMRFDCTYSRFTRDGSPIRAEVRNLTLHVLGAHGSGDQADGTSAGIDTSGLTGSGDQNSDPLRALSELKV
ncbi:hypothetical protein [Streptomyces sp. NPDC051014]|uniref:CIS tube protein n=1 Tax=Streptomyces sp. NPDC051014 TaxID=3155751 RepID=UPI0033DCC161